MSDKTKIEEILASAYKNLRRITSKEDILSYLQEAENEFLDDMVVNIEVRGGVVEVANHPDCVEVIVEDKDCGQSFSTPEERDLKVHLEVSGGVVENFSHPRDVKVNIEDFG